MAGIKDVAAKAGVSISTVSYVVSGKRKIGEETRERVRQAALELGYRPVVEATEPADATHVLAVSSPLRPYTDVANYAAFFFALATASKRHGYDILLLMHEAGDRELKRVAEQHMADGVFLLDVLLSDSRADMAGAIDIPVVSIGYTNDTSNVYTVDMDFARMGREAMEKAHVLGHRHVMLYCPDRRAFLDGSNFLVRFLDAAMQRGEELGMDVVRKFASGRSADDVNLAVDEAFGEDPDITAIICEENAAQMGLLMTALGHRGLRVPQDVSVMAACANGSSARLADELPMNPNAVCERAVDVMMEVLRGERHDVGYVELLPSEYCARGTMRARQ
ncbi:LacI family transcriptional regulator [Bifidobacterium anseris]|uniref:LacI family transcriptional regulator n=1 Tax=Bifidobacterium anseris TaxID=2020963 RepID=A0A2N5J037_9BIFI|nr:LacI family DNA-binding transcriptional regulator [Bifidobacterium anseris]PLS27578.1 LacI family transcriptional regulator [Bifidobacterium anseris]